MSSVTATQPNQGQVKQVLVEPVTPVNARCRARAIRPPVTLRNFFKPASVNPDTVVSNTGQSSEGNAGQSSEGNTGQSSEGNTGQSSEGNTGQSRGGNTGQSSEGNTGQSSEDDPSIQETSNQLERLVPESSSEVQAANLGDGKGKEENKSKVPATYSSKTSRKRALNDVDNSPVSKRKKQSNLATMFANVTNRKKECSNRALICPICKKEFKDISNADLNAHIDNCLIE